MENKEKQRKPKASEQPEEVWRKRLFYKLNRRQFWKIVLMIAFNEIVSSVMKALNPPEFKNRPKHQGMQYKFRRTIKGRTITVFTSYGKYGKKVGYFGWVTLSGRGILTKRKMLFSSAVYDLDSFFETILDWVDAFIDIAEHWPTVGPGGPEYQLRHMPGILKMTEFFHTVKSGNKTTTTSFILYDCKTLSKKTVRFLKKKLRPYYKKQIKMLENNEGPIQNSRIVKASRRWDEALAASLKT